MSPEIDRNISFEDTPNYAENGGVAVDYVARGNNFFKGRSLGVFVEAIDTQRKQRIIVRDLTPAMIGEPSEDEPNTINVIQATALVVAHNTRLRGSLHGAEGKPIPPHEDNYLIKVATGLEILDKAREDDAYDSDLTDQEILKELIKSARRIGYLKGLRGAPELTMAATTELKAWSQTKKGSKSHIEYMKDKSGSRRGL